jgi:hypothetical protein
MKNNYLGFFKVHQSKATGGGFLISEWTLCTNMLIKTNNEMICSAQIPNSTSRLPSRPWFVYQKWNPVGHGQEVT